MSYEKLFQEIEELRKVCDQIMIYGFGSYGRNLYKILKRKGIAVNGFVVTNKSDNMDNSEIYIYTAKDLFDTNTGYILALNEKNYKEAKQYLLNNHVSSEKIINAGSYIEQSGKKRGMNNGSIEITTVIGCQANCKYCPQKQLLNSYYLKNKTRKSMMDLKTFGKALDFFPHHYDISFGGMSEPFLNPDFIEMLNLACEQNRNISLYTTLVGVKREQIDQILSLPISFVVVHVADRMRYANIDTNDEYYEILSRFINARRKDGTPFVNMCNAQTEPDGKVREICEGKYEILTEMTDRAGNLDDIGLISNCISDGKISCSNYGTGLNNNILLPDGTVVLCCMDFGLKHILGNINVDSFEDIMNSPEMKRVKEGMNGNQEIDILCRSCSYARKID